MTKLNDASGQGRESLLPPIAEIAAEIRKGAKVDDLCQQYGISRSTLSNRFTLAGYTLATGKPHAQRHDRPAPLESQHVGAGGQHVGGGDYQGLPTTPVQYRNKPRPTGLDWDAITANYEARGGKTDPSVWAESQGKNVVVMGTKSRSHRLIHTIEESDSADYQETQTPAPKRTRRRATSGAPQSKKLSDEQRIQIGRRYQFGESLMELAKAYDVAVNTIVKTLAGQGIPTRTLQQAGKVTRERNAS